MGTTIRAIVVGFAGLVGGALGAAVLSQAAAALSLLALSFVPGGIHSDWSILALLGVLVGVGLGGLLGIWAGVEVAKFLLKEPQAKVTNESAKKDS